MSANRAANLPSIVGKFYIRDNTSSAYCLYWMGSDWTKDPRDAIVFDSATEAHVEIDRIAEVTDKVAIVRGVRYELPTLAQLQSMGRA